MGRATQGVKLIDLSKRNDTIASVCKVASDPEEAAEKEAEADINGSSGNPGDIQPSIFDMDELEMDSDSGNDLNSEEDSIVDNDNE